MGAVIAKCALCPQTAASVRVYGPTILPNGKEGYVCQHHMNNPTETVERSVFEPKVPGKKSDKVERMAWYAQMLKEAPKYSENDPTAPLVRPPQNPATIVCHIVPKELVPSVKFHPLNRWYGNAEEHDYYDKHFRNEAALMYVAPECIRRFAVFMHLIPPSEMKHVAQWLINGAVQYQRQQLAEKVAASAKRNLDNRTPVKKSKPRSKK